MYISAVSKQACSLDVILKNKSRNLPKHKMLNIFWEKGVFKTCSLTVGFLCGSDPDFQWKYDDDDDDNDDDDKQYKKKFLLDGSNSKWVEITSRKS